MASSGPSPSISDASSCSRSRRSLAARALVRERGGRGGARLAALAAALGGDDGGGRRDGRGRRRRRQTRVVALGDKRGARARAEGGEGGGWHGQPEVEEPLPHRRPRGHVAQQRGCALFRALLEDAPRAEVDKLALARDLGRGDERYERPPHVGAHEARLDAVMVGACQLAEERDRAEADCLELARVVQRPGERVHERVLRKGLVEQRRRAA